MLSEEKNFKNFLNSLRLLIACATGENWHSVMFDCMDAGSNLTAVVFFLFFVLII